MPRSLAPLALALLVSGLPRPAAAADPLAVPLMLAEWAGVARRAFPATASVPLPPGRLPHPEGIWLAAPDGAPARVQPRALERWPDGSVRWLLLDFLADVPAKGEATYTLHDGPPPRTPSGPQLRMETGGGGRLLDTGPVRARVPQDGAALVSELAAGSTRLPGPIPLPELTVAGLPSGRPVPRPVAIETDGTIRTEVLLSGRYPQGVEYELRLAAFAGQPFLRVQLTLTDLADQPVLPIRSLGITVPGRFSAAEIGIDGATRRLGDLAHGHRLLQTDATPVLLDGTQRGRYGEGWARVTGPEAAVTVVSRYFWQEYPQALAVAGDGVRLDVLAGSEEPVLLGSGAAKTHEFWIAVEPARDARPAAELAAALRAPLVPRPPAEWIVASGALPQALAPDAPGARDFLARLTTAVTRYQAKAAVERWDDGPPVPCAERPREHPRVGFYGALNWGDWNFPGYRDPTEEACDAWGNLEYDLPQVLALGWAATGNRLFYDALVPAARHYRDVDVIHHWPEHPEWVGLNHPHKASHFARAAGNSVDLGHTWVEGLVSHYRLTGEVRSLAAARGIADVLARLQDKAGNPRQFGWPLIALVAASDATGERRYLDAAMGYAAAARRITEPTPAAGDWKMGILADGLAYAQAATGDEALRRWLTTYADAVVARDGSLDPRYALPLGYLAALAGDTRYRTAALRVAQALQIGEWGKPLAAMGRTGFRLLAPLATGVAPPRPPG